MKKSLVSRIVWAVLLAAALGFATLFVEWLQGLASARIRGEQPDDSDEGDEDEDDPEPERARRRPWRCSRR